MTADVNASKYSENRSSVGDYVADAGGELDLPLYDFFAILSTSGIRNIDIPETAVFLDNEAEGLFRTDPMSRTITFDPTWPSEDRMPSKLFSVSRMRDVSKGTLMVNFFARNNDPTGVFLSKTPEGGTSVTYLSKETLWQVVHAADRPDGLLMSYKAPENGHHNLVRVMYTPYLFRVEKHECAVPLANVDVPLSERTKTSRGAGSDYNVTEVSPSNVERIKEVCQVVTKHFSVDGLQLTQLVFYGMEVNSEMFLVMWCSKVEVKHLAEWAPHRSSSDNKNNLLGGTKLSAAGDGQAEDGNAAQEAPQGATAPDSSLAVAARRASTVNVSSAVKTLKATVRSKNLGAKVFAGGSTLVTPPTSPRDGPAAQREEWQSIVAQCDSFGVWGRKIITVPRYIRSCQDTYFRVTAQANMSVVRDEDIPKLSFIYAEQKAADEERERQQLAHQRTAKSFVKHGSRAFGPSTTMGKFGSDPTIAMFGDELEFESDEDEDVMHTTDAVKRECASRFVEAMRNVASVHRRANSASLYRSRVPGFVQGNKTDLNKYYAKQFHRRSHKKPIGMASKHVAEDLAEIEAYLSRSQMHGGRVAQIRRKYGQTAFAGEEAERKFVVGVKSTAAVDSINATKIHHEGDSVSSKHTEDDTHSTKNSVKEKGRPPSSAYRPRSGLRESEPTPESVRHASQWNPSMKLYTEDYTGEVKRKRAASASKLSVSRSKIVSAACIPNYEKELAHGSLMNYLVGATKFKVSTSAHRAKLKVTDEDFEKFKQVRKPGDESKHVPEQPIMDLGNTHMSVTAELLAERRAEGASNRDLIELLFADQPSKVGGSEDETNGEDFMFLLGDDLRSKTAQQDAADADTKDKEWHQQSEGARQKAQLRSKYGAVETRQISQNVTTVIEDLIYRAYSSELETKQPPAEVCIRVSRAYGSMRKEIIAALLGIGFAMRERPITLEDSESDEDAPPEEYDPEKEGFVQEYYVRNTAVVLAQVHRDLEEFGNAVREMFAQEEWDNIARVRTLMEVEGHPLYDALMYVKRHSK